MGIKHLVLDVSVVIDLWLGKDSAAITAFLMDRSAQNDVCFWIAASSLSVIDYVAKVRFKQNGIPSELVTSKVSELMSDLLLNCRVLSNFGVEQLALYKKAHDCEDAQIAAATRSLGKTDVCVISSDKHFDHLGEVKVRTPQEALEWVLSTDSTNLSAAEPIPFIDLATQQAAILPSIEKRINTVLRHGQYILGPEVQELEKKLEAYTGSNHCITVASGTEALLMSLMALGIGPGDEVITTPFTFVATAEVIVLVGATPIFVDVEPDTCNINTKLIEAAITSKTKAIMPVSLYGQPSDMDEINQIAARHGNIPVIEDAAQSFGADYKGRKSCNLSTIGCTSFFPSKPLGCYGDGGAIFTNNDSLAQAMREIRVHGQSKRYVHTRVGVGGRMDTLQCAILLAKLERFDWEVEQRLAIGNRYNQLFDQAGIARVQQRFDRTSVFAQYTVFVKDRDALQEKLKQSGIPTAVHYPVPLNEQPAYQHLCCPDCTPVSRALAAQVMSLPMSADLGKADQEQIIKNLR